MALQVWLPLNKQNDARNQGLSNAVASNLSYSASGKLGGCYAANGTICNWGSGHTSNGVTVAFWHKWQGAVPTGWVITLQFPYSDGDRRYYLATNNGHFYPAYREAGYETKFTLDDKWHHITMAVSDDGTSLSIYIDGILDGAIMDRSGFQLGGDLYMGQCYINDLRIYDHCLSPKEVKEIAKGLVLHYPLNDAYVEGTTNLVTSITKGGQTTVNGYEVTTSGVSKDTYFTLNLSEKIVAGNTYTISCRNNFDTGLYWDFPIGSQANQTLTWRITPGYSFYTFVANSGNSYWDKNTCFMDDLSGTARNAGKSFKMWDWQIEKKDHATPFVIGTRNETTVYDCSGYQNNGTISRALNCSADSPRYKISTHFTSSIPSRINLPSDMSCLSGNNEQTLSCWVKSSGLGSGMIQSGLISLGYGNTLFLDTSDYCYRIDNGSSLDAVRANQNPHDGNWHLVTATYKSGVASIYIDGVLKNSVSRIFSNRYINNGGNCIGTEVNNSPIYNLNGDISDIRMYTTALSADDIGELYNTSCIVNS